jgi:peptide-methionine (S)-S-oxide reductase
VSYEQLLEMALTSHDPFRSAFKGQYASLVLTHDEAQLAAGRAVAERLEFARGRKLATRIEPIGRFTNAEDYHQKYYLRQSRVLMADFRAMFGSDEVVFVNSTSAAKVNGLLGGNGTKDLLKAFIDELGLSEAGRAELIAKVGGRGSHIACSLG